MLDHLSFHGKRNRHLRFQGAKLYSFKTRYLLEVKRYVRVYKENHKNQVNGNWLDRYYVVRQKNAS
jgi:hypothetical protein